MRLVLYFVLSSCCFGLTSPLANGEDAAVATGDAVTDSNAPISATINAYVAAFNARDVDALVALWSPEGVYVSRTSGEQLTGRDAIAADFAAIFALENPPTLAVDTESIEFISPNVALERGAATVTHAPDDVQRSKYRAIYVRRNGEWLIDRVTEEAIVGSVSNYEKLKGLEWLIGDWVNQTNDLRIEITCQWTKNQNFISRRFTVASGDEIESSGLQVIGWDAKRGEIRSWLFDSDGGFVEGVWSPRDDRWVVQATATLADGGAGSFTAVFRSIDDGVHEWRKVNRVLDGELLPGIDAVVFERQ